MSDRQFLEWIHARLEFSHGENPNIDYMQRLKRIIAALEEPKQPEVTEPVFIVAWNPSLVSAEEYAEVVGALSDLVRAHGGWGLKRRVPVEGVLPLVRVAI